jgi:hypothetical protein
MLIKGQDESGLEPDEQLTEGQSNGGTSDNFYRGVITYLDRARGHGVVRSNRGREIRFKFPFVEVIGAPIGGRMPGIDLIAEGALVGFDVGWTSKGLRVTAIKPAVAHPPRNRT